MFIGILFIIFASISFLLTMLIIKTGLDGGLNDIVVVLSIFFGLSVTIALIGIGIEKIFYTVYK